MGDMPDFHAVTASGSRDADPRLGIAATAWPEAIGLDVHGGLASNAPADACAGEDAGLGAAVTVLADPWASAIARRAMHLVAISRMGRTKLSRTRVGPLPLNADGVDLEWLFAAPQEEFDAWRRDDGTAPRVLRTVLRWLEGGSADPSAAFGREFPAAELVDALLAECGERNAAIIKARLLGQTYQEISDWCGIGRARVGHLLEEEHRKLARAISVRLVKGFPGASLLAWHAGRLGAAVVDAASREQGSLRRPNAAPWIRRALPERDALVLALLEGLAPYLRPQAREAFDWFGKVGHEVGDGARTTLRWTQDDVDAVTEAFRREAHGRKAAPLPAVAKTAGLSPEDIAGIAPLAGLETGDGFLRKPGTRIPDLRHVWLTDFLRQAGRPLCYVEILMGAHAAAPWLGLGTSNLDRTLYDPSGDFERVGYGGLWRLRSDAGAVDPMPVPCPDLPAPRKRLAPALAEAAIPRAPILAGLDPSAPEFVDLSAERIAAALEASPPGARSVSEALGGADLNLLRRWMREDAAGLREDAPFGLVLAAAAVAVWRSPQMGSLGWWRALRASCGPGLCRTLFHPNGAVDRRMVGAWAFAASEYGLRQAFAAGGRTWATFLRLQAGLAAADLDRLAGWLDEEAVPAGIRHLAGAGPNHSPEFELLWQAFGAYRHGEIGEMDLARLRASPWWPGWSLAEACSALQAPRQLATAPLPDGGVEVAAAATDDDPDLQEVSGPDLEGLKGGLSL